MASFYFKTDLRQTNKSKLILLVVIPFVLACMLFFPLFIFKKIGFLDFWWWMSVNVMILTAFSLISDSSYKGLIKKDFQTNLGKKIFWGILSALFLYAIFYIGRECSQAVFWFAEKNIESVYTLKQGTSLLKITILVMLVIAPGEEIFWRGFLQRNWEGRFGRISGFVLCSILYTLVHLGSGNIMLVLAAAVCGFFWGGLYLWQRSIILIAVSHMVWDILIFILLPL